MKLNRLVYTRLFFILISVCFISGCWDLQEVDKLAFATTIGIDPGPQDSVNLSIQVPIVQTGLPPVITGGKEEKKFFIVNQIAASVTDAFDHLETKATRSIVLNQAKSVIIGEAIAHKDIRPIMNHFIRTTQMPLPAYIFVTDTISAEQVLTLEPVQNLLPGMLLITAGQSIIKYDMTYFIQHWQFQQKLIHRSKDAYAPLISIDQVHRLYVVSGLAVFNGYRMVGKLSSQETEIFGLLTGLQKSGLMTFNIPGGKLSLRNVHGKTKIKVNMEHRRPFFKIETVVYGAVTELTIPKLTISPQDIVRYQKIIAEEIENRTTDLVKKLQEYNSDIINFGEEFRVQHQNIWNHTDWKSLFPTAPFEVKVKVHIEGDGRFR